MPARHVEITGGMIVPGGKVWRPGPRFEDFETGIVVETTRRVAPSRVATRKKSFRNRPQLDETGPRNQDCLQIAYGGRYDNGIKMVGEEGLEPSKS